MANTEWSSTSWSFLRNLEKRSASLSTSEARLAALEASAARVPHKALWRLWPVLLLLTISGIHSRYRNMRIEMSARVARFLNADELLNLCVQEMRQGHGSGYLRTLLMSKPGDCWSRLRYPLELCCGQLLDRSQEEAEGLQHLWGSDSVLDQLQGQAKVHELPHQVEADLPPWAAWQATREALSHPDCTDTIRAQLRAHLGLASVG